MANKLEFCLSLLICIMNIHFGIGSISGGGGDQVLLTNVQSLTLYNGRMTNSRRSGPVPQLKCVGGSAGCGAFVPQVVQCTNKGSDGYDVQWECKTDMDNAYRFGRVEVTCEGYDYPEDPSVLRGSCGLEYTIDLTEEGHQRKHQQHHNYGSHYNSYNDDYHDRSSYQSGYGKKASSVLGDLILLCAIGGVVYIIYKTCIVGSQQTENGYPNQRQDNQWGSSQPPPPGFRQDYMPGGDSCSGSSYYSGGHTNYTRPGNMGGGFWTGAATGGLLGYMFGNRGNNYYGSRTYSPYTGSSFWGQSRTHRPSAFSGGSSFSSFGGGGSSGTRTASGFGGTKRR
ncbi:store-operated calcium entry-associated regulatory factor-like isoform X1 [Ylistrum balloti]|uniref:store-operated calcium entry-associated regulatory factor-like isoform X1 n=2 Tax=Ylistrum balloti TaxID=509963 RepID=UPI00290582D2|nr:store-operated calcium entry-associated regulatory factor-like isoform X1 [Ylistrum balloti]